MKRKNLSEFNSNNKTSKRDVLDPQEKTTLETQTSINQQKTEMNSRAEVENKIAN